MSLQMDLVTKVKPGTVSTNFEEFKELVRKEMEDNFKTIVVTEDQLQSAKDARATLNKAKAALKDAVKSMQAENDEPLKTAKSQAKELEAILDDAISTLDSQIKTIENRQREQNMEKAMNVLASKLDRLSQEQNKFAVECMSWLQNPKWANKGTSFQSIMKECDEKVALIQQAWDLLEGDFRPQMLENFKQYGDLAKAQLYGKELERQRKAYEHLTPKSEPEPNILQVPPIIPNSENNRIQENTVSDPGEPREIVIEAPIAYRKDDETSMQKCKAVFKLVGRRYELEWLLATCERFGITLTRQQKEA